MTASHACRELLEEVSHGFFTANYPQFVRCYEVCYGAGDPACRHAACRNTCLLCTRLQVRTLHMVWSMSACMQSPARRQAGYQHLGHGAAVKLSYCILQCCIAKQAQCGAAGSSALCRRRHLLVPGRAAAHAMAASNVCGCHSHLSL